MIHTDLGATPGEEIHWVVSVRNRGTDYRQPVENNGRSVRSPGDDLNDRD